MTQPTVDPSHRIVPEWLQNLSALGWRVLVSVALLIVVAAIAMAIGTVTASILVAGIVAATFAPFVLRLRERGWSRTRAAAAVMAGILVVFTITSALIALAFIPYAQDLAVAIQAGEAALKSALSALESSPEAADAVNVATTSTSSFLGAAARGVVQSVTTVATIVILAGFLVFFFLQDGDRAWVWLFQAMRDSQRQRITSAGDDALARVGGYLRGTAVLAAINASTSFVFLYVLGVPLAAPLAVLVFLGGFIPYVGGVITTIVILLVAYAARGFQVTAVLFLLIAVRNVIVSNVVRPLIYGRTVNIHPALVLVALPAGAALGGIVGLFVAIPITAMILAVAGAAAAILDPGVTVEDPLVPGWLERLAAWSWRLLVAIGIGVLGLAAFAIMPLVALPLVLATILAATFSPFIDRLVARGYHRGRAAVGVTFGGFALVVIVLSLAVVNLVGQAEAIAAAARAGADTVDSAAGGGAGWLSSVVAGHGEALVSVATGLASAVASLAVVFLLGCLLCFYFLRDGGAAWRGFVARMPSARGAAVGLAGSRAYAALGGYVAATAVISAFGAATQFLIMVVLGLPLAFPLAVLSFIGGFIPYIGSAVTTVAALLVTIAVGSPTDVAVMLTFTIVFNIVQGNVVAPIVYGRAVNLHPAVVLMAIPAGLEIAGVVGMFLAVPVIAVVAASWRPILGVFGRPLPEPSD